MAVVDENRPRTVQIVVSVIQQPPFSSILFIRRSYKFIEKAISKSSTYTKQ
jgi:hypothetical protein